MSDTHSHTEDNDLSTAQLIILFCVFALLFLWLGDTFTAIVGILSEAVIFAVAYNEKHKLMD